MQAKTFSKAYLQSIPILRKNDYINSFIDNSIGNIENAAAIGKTSYLINLYMQPPLSNPHNITNDELIVVCKERFPDCKVSYVENYGIQIDWS